MRNPSGEGWSCVAQQTGSACTHPGLAVGQQAPLVLDVELPYGLNPATVAAQVSSQNTDDVPENNSAAVELSGDPSRLELAGGGLACSAAGGGGGDLAAIGAVLLPFLLRRQRARRSPPTVG